MERSLFRPKILEKSVFELEVQEIKRQVERDQYAVNALVSDMRTKYKELSSLGPMPFREGSVHYYR